MMNDATPLRIANGMDVVGSDDEKVGSVADMRDDYIVVSKGFFFPTDYYIPVSAISTADESTVYLNVSKDAALHQGWDAPPATTDSAAYGEEPIVDAGLNVQNPVGTVVEEDTEFVDTRETDLHAYDTAERVDTGLHAHDTAERVDTGADESITVPLTEEELTARTREVDRGGVRVEKVVRSEEQTLDVPVTEEHLHVTRRAVDRDVDTGELTFEESTIEVPLHAEEVEVDTRARVREEVEVTKHATTETQRVQGTVRREDVQVTDETGAVVDEEHSV